MTKYHISPETGRPNICRANNSCPLKTDDGQPAPHFTNKEDAREYFEKTQDNNKIHTGLTKKKEEPVVDNDTQPVKKKRGRPKKNPDVESVSTKNAEIDDFDNEDDYSDFDNDTEPTLEDLDFNEDDMYEDAIIDDYDNDGESEDVCDQCGEEDYSVRLRIDPYEQENGNTVWRPLCDNCFEDLQSY